MMNKLLVSLLLLLALGACNNSEHSHEGEGAHAHGNELEPLAYTLYTDKTEVFVEFKPLVVGSSSRFATHVTVLGESFKALTEGTVTVSLLVNGKGIKNTVNAPSSPGIFRLALQPTQAGTGKLVFDIVTKTYTDQLIIDSVTIYPDEATALKNQPKDEGGNDISYLKEQAWKVDFATMNVKRGTISEVIKTSGELVSPQMDEVMVVAKTSGLVLFKERSLIGKEVNAGAHLFTITGKGVTDNNIDVKFQESRAEFERADKEYNRQLELRKENINAEKDLEQAKLRFEHAKSNYSNIASTYQGGQKISAPQNGFVKSVFVTEGQYVETGQPLMQLSKNKNIVLKAEVSQKYFSRLPFITSANFRTSYDSMFYDIRQFNGKVISFGKNVQSQDHFIPIYFQLENRGNIVPGSYADVYLKSGIINNTIAIPLSSVLEENGNYYVYVQSGGESFQKRYIKTGVSDGINVQVVSGINEGEMLVTKGAYQIKLSSQSSAIPAHGHEH
jgi:membrane fusion protein, heavy metal efflux system